MPRWIFKMSSCGSNVGTETTSPLVDGVVNNALFHSNSRINQMPPQIIHIVHFFWYTRYLRFCDEMNWGQDCSTARNLELHTGLLRYCTFGPETANNAQIVRVDTGRGKGKDQQILWQEAQLMLPKPRDASIGQSRSPNMVPLDMFPISVL